MNVHHFHDRTDRWVRVAGTGVAATVLFLLSGCSGGSSTREYPLVSETRLVRAGDRATYKFAGELNGTATVVLRTAGDLIQVDTDTRFQTPQGTIEASDTETYRQTDGDLLVEHLDGFALDFPKRVAADTRFSNIRRVCAEEDEQGACLREDDEAYEFEVVGQETVTVPAGKFEAWKVEVTQGEQTDTWYVAPQIGMFPVKAVTNGLTMTLQSIELK
jgi:hypothetical protein